MSNLVVDEVLFAYLAIAFYAISFVLIQVDNSVQRPVYYMSKSLRVCMDRTYFAETEN